MTTNPREFPNAPSLRTALSRVVWDLVRAWPYSREETAHHLRFCCGGLFLVLAVLVLLVPPAFGLRGHQRDV